MSKNQNQTEIKELLQELYKKGNEENQTSQTYIQQIIPILKPLVEKKEERG